MNKILLSLFLVVATSPFILKSQNQDVKTGWNVGPLPAVGYDSDRGFLLGVTGELYNFGDGSIYPDFYHKFKTEVSFYTKGSANIQAYYDSKHLIEGLRTMFDIGYFPDKYYDFYGLNAYSYLTPKDSRSEIYNKVDRRLFRFQADFQGRMYKSLYLATGVGIQSYHIKRVKDSKYKDDITLYDQYKEMQLLSPSELTGGTHLLLKFGLMYDTRDVEADPSRGFCSEVIFSGSPDIIDRDGYAHLQLSLTHRHFINLKTDYLTLAFRILYQTTLAGDVPYYLLQNMQTFFQKRLFNEGLGGNTTIRGFYRNRIVSNGEGLANLELRWKFSRFKLLKQNFELAFVPFADAGMILKEYESELFSQQEGYEDPTGKLYMSLGAGLKIIMNQNFIVSIDMGKALQKQDGNIGFYILLNYMF